MVGVGVVGAPQLAREDDIADAALAKKLGVVVIKKDPPKVSAAVETVAFPTPRCDLKGAIQLF